MIQINNLTKRFLPDVVAVNDLSIEIKQGVTGLIGENGAGKSTLLRLIADVYYKDEGEILIDSLANDSLEAKNNLFFLSDDPFYSGNGNAIENLKFYQSLFDLDENIFKDMMSKLSLPLDRRVSTFSKGMRRQLFLCIALSMKAKYILLDEAFDGLDPIVQDVVKEEIVKNSKEKTFLISSHNLSSLERLCDSFILLSKGKLKKEGEKQDMGKSLFKYQILFKEEVTIEQLEKEGIEVVNLRKMGSITYLITSEDVKDLIIGKFNPSLIENVVIEKDEALRLEMMMKEGDK